MTFKERRKIWALRIIDKYSTKSYKSGVDMNGEPCDPRLGTFSFRIPERAYRAARIVGGVDPRRLIDEVIDTIRQE